MLHINAALTLWLSSSLFGAWQLWSRQQARAGGQGGDQRGWRVHVLHRHTNKRSTSRRRGSLTVPVIVVLLVAVTVQVQVRAAGGAETGRRQQVREICSFNAVSSPLHCLDVARHHGLTNTTFLLTTQPENDIGVFFFLLLFSGS